MDPLGENRRRSGSIETGNAGTAGSVLKPAASPARAAASPRPRSPARSPRAQPTAEETAAAERTARRASADRRAAARKAAEDFAGEADEEAPTQPSRRRRGSVEAIRTQGKVAALSPRLATASPPRMTSPRRSASPRPVAEPTAEERAAAERAETEARRKSGERRAAARKAAEEFANEADEEAPAQPSRRRRGSVEAIRGNGVVAALSPRLATASPPRMTSPRPASPRPAPAEPTAEEQAAAEVAEKEARRKSSERRAAARKAAEDFANEDLEEAAPSRCRRGSVEVLRGTGLVSARSPRKSPQPASSPRPTSPRPASPRPIAEPTEEQKAAAERVARRASADRRAAAHKAAQDFAQEDEAPKPSRGRRGSVEALRGTGIVAARSPRMPSPVASSPVAAPTPKAPTPAFISAPTPPLPSPFFTMSSPPAAPAPAAMPVAAEELSLAPPLVPSPVAVKVPSPEARRDTLQAAVEAADKEAEHTAPLEDHLGDLLAIPPARQSVSRRETVQLEDDLSSMLAAVEEEAPVMPPPAPRPSEVDASRRETVQLESDLGSMLAAVEEEAPAASPAEPEPMEAEPTAVPKVTQDASRRETVQLETDLGSMLEAVDEAPPSPEPAPMEAEPTFAPRAEPTAAPEAVAAPEAMTPPAPVAMPPVASAAAQPSKKRKSLEALGCGHVAELRKRHLANVADDSERHRQREREAALARSPKKAADVGGLVGLFEGAVDKHRREKARRLSTVSDLSTAAKARRRSSVAGSLRCTFTNVSQSPAVLIVAVEAPGGLVLEHVHRSVDEGGEPAWIRADESRVEVTITTPGSYVFAARGVNAATGTVLAEARTAVFELTEPTETLEALSPTPAANDVVRPRTGRRSSVVMDVGAKRLWLSEHVRFNGNATTIHDDSSELIDQLANMLQAHQNVDSLRLEGHTNSKCGLDCVGGDHVCSNGVCQRKFGGANGGAVAFSLGRANGVADALVQRGIDRSRLVCVGLAGSRRVADDTEGPLNASNRRVEIHLADEDL